MSAKYPGGIISANAVIPNPNTQTNTSGVWTVDQADYWTAKNQWPMPYPRQSLRFNSADSAYLTKTPATAGSRTTWTWSGWIKRSTLSDVYGDRSVLFGGYGAMSNTEWIEFGFGNSGDAGGYNCIYSTTSGFSTGTTSLYRDISAWYHIVIALDTTQAVQANRLLIYVNGVLTDFPSASFGAIASQNVQLGINGAWAHTIGKSPYSAVARYFNGYMTEINFVDGLALTPTSFGQTDANTGAWIPQTYVGSYGTNGFYLPTINNSGADSFGVGIDSSVPNLNRVELGNTTVGYSVLGTMTYGVGAAAVNLRDNNATTAAADPNGINVNTAMGYDFGRPIQIRKISTLTALANGVSNTITLSIQYSDDNSTWTTVSGSVTTHTISAGLGQANTSTISENGFHRYWRLIYASGTIGGDCWIATLDMFITNIGPNSWYPVNFSVAAGSGNDSLVDSPWNFGIDYGYGNEVRGNYATFNQIAASGATCTNGNLDVTAADNGLLTPTTFFPTTGKWYCEIVWNSGANPRIGVTNTAGVGANLGSTANSWAYLYDGRLFYNNAVGNNTGVSVATGDILMMALDLDAGYLWYGKNGVWMPQTSGGAVGVPSLGVNQTQSFTANQAMSFAVSSGGGTPNWTGNFGQRPFAYTAPTGFKALCTQNLPTPAIGATSSTLASKNFAPVLYTGNSSTQTITTDFQPDLVWIKSRSTADVNTLQDVIRGARYYLISNSTAAEATQADSDGVSAFTSTGFTLGYTDSDAWNKSPNTYVSWNWKAGGTAVTNTAGTISSQVSANPTAGISVVSYTGNNTAGATVGHGLGAAPKMIIVKSTGVENWGVYHYTLGATNGLLLNDTSGAVSSPWWNGAVPTSTTFSLSSGSGITNTNTQPYIAYCFAEVAGFSKISSYVGNGSADGPFVYCGFRPRYIVIKRNGVDNWFVHDTARNTYNAVNLRLYPNTSGAEASNVAALDIVSNGFKIRTSDTSWNTSGGTFVFIAFAETPFNYSRAR